MAIARMTRVFVVGPADREEATIRFLQSLGVLHVEPAADMAEPFDQTYAHQLAEIKRLDRTIRALQRFRNNPTTPPLAASENLVELAESKLNQLQETEFRKAGLERLREDLERWGNFDPDQVRSLEKRGVRIHRYRMGRKEWAHFDPPKGVYLEVVDRKQAVWFYTLSLGQAPEIPRATRLSLPDLSLEQAREEIQALSETIATLRSELAGIATDAAKIRRHRLQTLNEARRTQALGTLYREPHLFGLKGWIPQSEAPLLEEKISGSALPLRIVTREPEPEEEPPVLLRNNRFIRRIEPLLKLYGQPKYRDVDPSYFFAPFMVLFFGICLSDAGYGLLFFLTTLAIGKRFGGQIKGLPPVLALCQALSLASIAVGLITGSFFGYPFENRSWILLDLDIDAGNPLLLFYLALGLGLLHLTCSYILGMIQARSRVVRMQKLGLGLVLWGGVLLIARALWLSESAPVVGETLWYGAIAIGTTGLLLTLFFASESGNWGVRIGIGLWNIYGLTGLVGDLLSYARLFGLGIATASIASVMNQLAGMAMDGVGPPIGVVLALAILLVGHAFNFALALLGSTVHSARLHFVEGFKSFFEGGGNEYKPLKTE